MNYTAPERAFFTNRNLQISYLDSAPGDLTRPLVLLLHGFPDESSMWLPLIPELHTSGYRVLAPDTIGCGHSDIAPRLRDYDVHLIIGDHLAMLKHLNIDKSIHVVGHDWGAAQAWIMAGHHPEKIRSLCAVSVGHIASFVRGGFRQKLMSWYILYFHLAGLAERWLLGRGRFGLDGVLRTHPEIGPVYKRMSVAGRLTAALRLYRANVLKNFLFAKHPRVSCNVLGVYSSGDLFLDVPQMKNSVNWVDGHFRYETLDGGHWIPLDQPEVLAQLLLPFLEAETAG